MTKNSWTVNRKGHFEKIVIVLLGFYLLVYIFCGVFGVWRNARADGYLLEALFFVWLFTLPIAFVLIRRIVKLRTPLTITFDIENSTLNLVYSSKRSTSIAFNELAYSVLANKEYKVLSFFKTYMGSRNQTVYNEETELYGINDSSSWAMYEIEQIEQTLKELNIVETKPRSSKLPLWERMISN